MSNTTQICYFLIVIVKEDTMNFRINLQYFSSMSALIILMVLSAGTIAFLFIKPISQFNPIGKESFVMNVTPEVIAAWGHEPTHVKTGFLIHEFLEFDAIKNDFIMNAVVSFEFDSTKVSLEAISKFSFTKGDILEKSDPVVKKTSDTLTFVQYYIRIKFTTLFDYTLFPLDDHKLSLNLTNNAVEAQDVIFDITPENFIIPQYVFLAGWKIDAHAPVSGYVEFASQIGKPIMHPKIIFSIDMKKQDIRQLLLIFLPLFILFYITMFVLAAKDFATDVNTMLFVITAFVANAIVIQGMSPDVAYFMLIDYFTLFFLILMFLVFIMSFLETLPQKLFKKYVSYFTRFFNHRYIYCTGGRDLLFNTYI